MGRLESSGFGAQVHGGPEDFTGFFEPYESPYGCEVRYKYQPL